MSNENDKIEPGLGNELNDVPEATEQESPDFLAAPKRGKGVRRLNRVPLFIVGGVVGLAALGITYTLYERQQAQLAKARAPVEAPALDTAAKPPVAPAGGSDLIGGPPAPPAETVIGGDPTIANPQALQQQPGAQQHSEAYMKRMEQIARIENRRLSEMEAALGAEGTVSSFNNRSNAAAAGQQQQAGAGMMAAANNAGTTAGQEMQKYLAALGATSPGASGMDGMGGFGGMGMGAGGGNDMVATNRQAQKQAFLSGTPEADTYLAAQRKAAVAISQEVKAGTIIPGVMISGINSDLPGQIIAQVRENVFDSATGTQLLIPAGSRLVGTYDSGVTLGQERALVAWNRLIYPDSSSISLGTMPGADLSGYGGFKDKVNNHYWRIFGNGLLLSLFSAGITIAQNSDSNDDNDEAAILRAETGRQMGQLGMAMAQRNMSIQPTIEIRPGYQFNVMVTKDIILPTWQGHPMAAR